MIFGLQKMITSWAEDHVYPALDLLRISLTHPEGNKSLSNYGTFANAPGVFHKVASFLLGRYSSQIISLKYFTNGLAYQGSRECVGFIIDDVIEGIKFCETSEKKNRAR